MNAAELFVKCLENEGVQFICGVPGEENEHFLFALENSDIRFIPTRHEQGAAFIANVYGRITGQPGVCLSTLGPGATNLITGVADAFLDKSPVVTLTAQGSMTRMHHESHQMIDIVHMFQPITKWNTSVKDPIVIPEVVRKAFKLAALEKPGATHIELPEDIASKEIHEKLYPLTPGTFKRPSPDKDLLAQAAQLINLSDKPIILAGNGSIRNRASKALCALSGKFNIPVASTFMGKGAISADEPTALGTLGLGFKDYIHEAFEQADCIISIGYDIAEYDPKKWNIGTDKKIIHIDFEASEVYAEYMPAIELYGDLANGINLLIEHLDKAPKTVWYNNIRNRIRDSIDQYTLDDASSAFTVPAIINAAREVMDDDALLISDVGSHKMWIARNYETHTPNGCIISNGLASMGISLPGGIAAKLADPDRQVVAMMGDGGALMNIQELETANRLGVGYTIIVLNDNNYGLIEWKQEQSQGKSFGTKISNPDFAALARSFNLQGYKPKNIGEFKKVLSHTLQTNELSLIEVPVNADVNKQITQELENYFNQ